MAYFSNGTEGDQYEEKYCIKCVNWRDKDNDGAYGCPIWDLHMFYAYEECNGTGNAKAMLDHLIPMNKETHFAEECSMFLPEPK